ACRHSAEEQDQGGSDTQLRSETSEHIAESKESLGPVDFSCSTPSRVYREPRACRASQPLRSVPVEALDPGPDRARLISMRDCSKLRLPGSQEPGRRRIASSPLRLCPAAPEASR